MLLTEAAGFDVVLIETVGVGQSETAVADMVDMFLLLLSPGGGDELQGIKRGIMELADLVVVNKADGDLVAAARRAAMEYKAALHLMRPKSAYWQPDVMLASALNGVGINEIWSAVEAHHKALGDAGEIASHRGLQAQAWMWTEIREGLLGALKGNKEAARLIPKLEAEVRAGTTTPTLAAQRLLGLVFGVGKS
jgi:LAO/AO transport system kinase